MYKKFQTDTPYNRPLSECMFSQSSKGLNFRIMLCMFRVFRDPNDFFKFFFIFWDSAFLKFSKNIVQFCYPMMIGHPFEETIQWFWIFEQKNHLKFLPHYRTLWVGHLIWVSIIFWDKKIGFTCFLGPCLSDSCIYFYRQKSL